MMKNNEDHLWNTGSAYQQTAFRAKIRERMGRKRAFDQQCDKIKTTISLLKIGMLSFDDRSLIHLSNVFEVLTTDRNNFPLTPNMIGDDAFDRLCDHLWNNYDDLRLMGSMIKSENLDDPTRQPMTEFSISVFNRLTFKKA